MEKRIFVIGLGLIGGSIALAIKQERIYITGYDVNETTMKLAQASGVIDEYTTSIEAEAPNADYIIIAAPVVETVNVLKKLSLLPLKKGVIITDVGSTKLEIMKQADRLFGDQYTFIGGHPMAGSHKSGITAARPHLFENAFYVLTPSEHCNIESIEALKALLAGSRANFIVLTPEEHDLVVGAISHFPHVIAAGLVHQIQKLHKENPLVTSLAAGGFRDITRIASSSPVMWRDILLHNKDTLLTLLRQWREELDRMEELLSESSGDLIHDYFAEAKSFRDHLPQRAKGAIPAFYDLYVDVPDVPGIISTVTGYLALEQISITNIRIIEAREDVLGVLRISFRSEEERVKGIECLKARGYETFMHS